MYKACITNLYWTCPNRSSAILFHQISDKNYLLSNNQPKQHDRHISYCIHFSMSFIQAYIHHIIFNSPFMHLPSSYISKTPLTLIIQPATTMTKVRWRLASLGTHNLSAARAIPVMLHFHLIQWLHTTRNTHLAVRTNHYLLWQCIDWTK